MVKDCSASVGGESRLVGLIKSEQPEELNDCLI